MFKRLSLIRRINDRLRSAFAPARTAVPEEIAALRSEPEKLYARVLELNHLYEHEKQKLRHTWHPPGHFYSPYPDLDDIRARQSRIFAIPSPDELVGIDLREREQLALLDDLANFCRDHHFPANRTDGTRYYFENPAYSYGDGLILYGMLLRARPRRVIEIGSGYSSCVILDTNDRHFEGRIACTFIEPYPELLHSLLLPTDSGRLDIRAQPLQDVELDLFQRLEAGDILFIDSTHVTKTGGDVNYLIFQILPALAPGVVVHIHDMFYPFEYPPEWVLEGRGWNEAYILRAFLSFNRTFEIVFWSDFVAKFHRDHATSRIPLWGRNTGGNLWLRRVQDT